MGFVLYSKNVEYAIRACVHMAQTPAGQYALVRNIAEDQGIPAPFLAKVLQELARKGLLRSSKGPAGGFALQATPGDVRLLDLVEALDGLSCYEECPSGLAECSDDMPCSLHDRWIGLRAFILEYLGDNTIADLVKTLDSKRRCTAGRHTKGRSTRTQS